MREFSLNNARKFAFPENIFRIYSAIMKLAYIETKQCFCFHPSYDDHQMPKDVEIVSQLFPYFANNSNCR